MSKKKDCKVARIKKAASELERRDRAMKVEYRPVRFVKKRRYDGRVAIGPYVERVFVKDTQDAAVKRPSAANIETQADRGDSTPDRGTSNPLEGINGIIHLLRDAGFLAGVFDAKKLLDCKQDQVRRTCRLLYDGLITLTGEYKHEDQAFLAIADTPSGYHTGSSQYAPAESEIESDEPIGIQRMELGISGETYPRDRMVRIKEESRSAAACAREEVRPNIPGPIQTYLEAAMRHFQQEQREQSRQAVYPSQNVRRTRKQETYIPDVEM